MRQRRFVSYIYRYRENKRCENAGFIKVWHISNDGNNLVGGDQARIQIGIKIRKKMACKCNIFLLYHTRAKNVTDIYIEPEERDIIMKKFAVSWDDALSDGKPFNEYDGLLFLCDDGEILIGLWNEYDISVEDILIDVEEEQGNVTKEEFENETIEKIVGVMTENDGDIMKETDGETARETDGETVRETDGETAKETDGETVNETDGEAVNETDENAGEEMEEKVEGEIARALEDDISSPCSVDKMLSTYQRLPMLIDSPFKQCVKIVPQDIGKLNIRNWKLGNNSFLTHGYYNYRYLMLGKIKDGKCVLGVPGVFTNKEKYMANMFGFRTFVPVKKTDVLTGSFGYWVIEVFSE